MSDLTAKVTKTADNGLEVEGYEALKYNFHYDTPVFDLENPKMAKIYERWQRVLIVMDTSEWILDPGAEWRVGGSSEMTSGGGGGGGGGAGRSFGGWRGTTRWH